ncbi:MAG: tetratricopeptide repeat protein, partial [Gammaproteobacteria bacterium]|nr:tetratricopeptide repeat protein [Gammaproteobacteria bacterium]
MILLVCLPALAQRQALEAVPPVATELHPGLGDYHFPISTPVDDAQVYFDQGIALLYGFNHDEAARYFRRAAELDPAAPMPYWGLALSIGPNYNDTAVDENRAAATYDAVQNALARIAAASPRERAYIDAIAIRYASPEPDADWAAFHVAYSDAMRAVAAAFPDDLDAATMFAESLMMLRPWQLWTAAGEPVEGTLELVAVLESVLRRNPNHPGANHFYIHAVEASPNLERAIPSAQRLMTLMPGAGHLVHMPGHIYLQTGDYDLAADTNVRAAEADDAFIARTGATGIYPLMYSTHNVHFIAYARAQQGRYDEAREAALRMVEMTGDADIEMGMQMLEAFRLYPLMVDLRFHEWDSILASRSPSEQRALERAFWLYARAMAYAGLGDLERARSEQARFELARSEVDAEALYLLNNSAETVLALAAAVLEASLVEAGGDSAGAVALWRRAVAAEAAIQYDEPPAWYYPVRQSLAAALLRAGRAEEAEFVFR